jgi:cell division protease FtsH
MTAPSDHPGPGPAPEGLAPPTEPPAAATPPPRRPTRPKASLWHRIRLLLLLGVIWLVVVWAAMADNPLLPFVDAVRIQGLEAQWLLWLMGLEFVRQVHYFLCERSSGYNRFWTDGVFGGFDRAVKRRFSDWTRYRLARVIKIVALIVLFAIVAGEILDTSPVLALFATPVLVW